MTNYSNVQIVHLTEPEQVELAYTVRYDVYAREQSQQIRLQTNDVTSQHWVALADKNNEDGTVEHVVPLGTIFLAPKPDNVAVIAPARGLKIGSKLIKTFERYCTDGFRTIYLHAVSGKRGFYEKLGYVAEGGDDEEFEEDGTPHIRLWNSFFFIFKYNNKHLFRV